MAIQFLHLKNFTVFDDFKLDVSHNINIFIGENGTGKTHLLKAIYSVCLASQNPNHIDSTATLLNCFNENQAEANLLRDKNIIDLKISIVPSDVEKKHIVSTEMTPCDFEEMKKFAPKANKSYFSRYNLEFPQNKKIFATYIPCKDMLTHSNGLLAMLRKYQNFPFDKTLTDIISKASQWKVKQIPPLAISILPILEEMMNGRVVFENDEFYILKRDGRKVIFEIEAEGLKKIGLLWQLLMTESIFEDSILLWDEPEANLNPKFFPSLAECLLALSRNGIQIFLATHNYIFAKYFDVLKNDSDNVKFHSLYFDNKINGVLCESNSYFESLKHNDISNAFNRLLELVYDLKVGE